MSRFGNSYTPVRSAPPPNPGFSGALVLRVSCPRGEFCLRGWPVAEADPIRLRGLRRLLASIEAAGVTQVAVPVASTDGTPLVAAGDRLWQLEPWMPGRADFHAHPTPQRLRAAVRSLAEWHRAAARFEARAEEAAWFAVHRRAPSPAIGERYRMVMSWTAERRDRLRAALVPSRFDRLRGVGLAILQHFERTAVATAGQLKSAAAVEVPLQPCLRDVWHDHVLFSGDDVTGLIDPAACRTESVAADLARLLGSLVGDDQRQWDLALEEYQRLRPLSLDELALVPIFDRSGVLLAGLTWLDRHFLRGEVDASSERVVMRLQEIRGRLERLV